MKLAAKLALFLLIPFAVSEYAARTSLFEHASYTNSKNIDRQLADLRERHDWRIVAIGDSEVRWGFDPASFDLALASDGLEGPTFNLAWDGFGTGLWGAVLPAISLGRDAPQLRVVLIGVQLIEAQSLSSSAAYQPGACGALQRPVLTSPLGIDSQLDTLCVKPNSQTVVLSPLRHLALFRYRQTIRSLILGGGSAPAPLAFTSNSLGHASRGYDPHSTYADNRIDSDFNLKRLREEKASDPKSFEPLPQEAWKHFVEPDGYFDQWVRLVQSLGWKPVFFALPTNPVLIDEKRRRADYIRNSHLLKEWAVERGQIYVDLGIRDHVPMEDHYSDHRHLSVKGAPVFSAELAHALATQDRFRDALR